MTLTVTLSRVITSWGGTSCTTTRRSTFTICCTNGMRMMRPGPFTPVKRPSVKTTPRSYSLKMRIAAERNMTTTNYEKKIAQIFQHHHTPPLADGSC